MVAQQKTIKTVRQQQTNMFDENCSFMQVVGWEIGTACHGKMICLAPLCSPSPEHLLHRHNDPATYHFAHGGSLLAGLTRCIYESGRFTQSLHAILDNPSEIMVAYEMGGTVVRGFVKLQRGATGRVEILFIETFPRRTGVGALIVANLRTQFPVLGVVDPGDDTYGFWNRMGLKDIK